MHIMPMTMMMTLMRTAPHVTSAINVPENMRNSSCWYCAVFNWLLNSRPFKMACLQFKDPFLLLRRVRYILHNFRVDLFSCSCHPPPPLSWKWYLPWKHIRVWVMLLCSPQRISQLLLQTLESPHASVYTTFAGLTHTKSLGDQLSAKHGDANVTKIGVKNPGIIWRGIPWVKEYCQWLRANTAWWWRMPGHTNLARGLWSPHSSNIITTHFWRSFRYSNAIINHLVHGLCNLCCVIWRQSASKL